MPKVDVGNDEDDFICPEMSGVVGAISTQAVLNFIDLAGSERASIHEASGSANNNQMGQAVRQQSPFGQAHRASGGTHQR